MYANDGWGWGAWIGMSLGMLAFAAVFVWAAVVLMRGRRFGDDGDRAPTPEDLLAHRLATGEIDGAEYQQRLDALHGAAAPPPALQ